MCLQGTFLQSTTITIPCYFSPCNLFLTLATSSIILLLVNTDYTAILPCSFVQAYNGSLFTIFSLYFSRSIPIDFSEIFSRVTSLPLPFLLLENFNYRHPLSGGSVTTSRGQLLESFIFNHDLGLIIQDPQLN